MHFHLFGDFRFPPNPDHTFDSYNTKLFRFISLFADQHKIDVYGPRSSKQYFSHPNITYNNIIDSEEYNNHDVLDPNVMLAGHSRNYTVLQQKFDAGLITTLCKNYQLGDIVVATASAPKFKDNILVINYSVGCDFTRCQYLTSETRFILDEVRTEVSTRINRVIEPYFEAELFPDVKVSREPNTYLFLGRCAWTKGLCRFMLIALHYKENNIPGKFIIAGPMVKTTSSDIGCALPFGTFGYFIKDFPNVEYVGICNAEQRNTLLRRAACLIQLSEYREPCGYNAIEAQYCGCPVIANNDGGFKETIRDGVTVFLTNDYRVEWKGCYENIQETVQAMSKISTIDNEACRTNVSNYFDKTLIYNKYINFFEDCLDDFITIQEILQSKQI